MAPETTFHRKHTIPTAVPQVPLFQATFPSGFEVTDNEEYYRKHNAPTKPLGQLQVDALREALLGNSDGVVMVRLSTFDGARRLASLLGAPFVATDAGKGCWPRYGASRMPQVGDKVSYAFNGDSYPDGEVVRVGAGLRAMVTTSTGKKYYRRRLSGSWVSEGGGAWSLVQGHVETRNPSF